MEKKTNPLLFNNIIIQSNYLIYYNMINKNYQGHFKLNNIFSPRENNIKTFQVQQHLKVDKKFDISENYEKNDKYIDKSNLTIYNYKEIIVNKVSHYNDDRDWIFVKNQNI